MNLSVLLCYIPVVCHSVRTKNHIVCCRVNSNGRRGEIRGAIRNSKSMGSLPKLNIECLTVNMNILVKDKILGVAIPGSISCIFNGRS
ncbi:hypothetical protein BD769DRAFT_1431231 [Suillus cothurnatus]|nr:hypothetical protein BD769DRAFT_1431231 [Suillus cothurnatus]